MKRIYVLLMLSVALGLGASCSSDPNTPLGSSLVDDSLIVSRPGEVFRDTIPITSGDKSFVINSFYPKFLTLPN
jgi:hypothetical protein